MKKTAEAYYRGFCDAICCLNIDVMNLGGTVNLQELQAFVDRYPDYKYDIQHLIDASET